MKEHKTFKKLSKIRKKLYKIQEKQDIEGYLEYQYNIIDHELQSLSEKYLHNENEEF